MERIEDFLLRVLGSVLGLAAIGCGGHTPAVEYGAPHATYHLSGTVTDAQTVAPIPGIHLLFQTFIVANSGQDGTFTVDGVDNPCTTGCMLRATDVDGAQNGAYQDKSVPLTLTQPAPGDGHWYYGSFQQVGLAVRLDPKP